MRLSKNQLVNLAVQIASIGAIILVWQLLVEFKVVSTLLLSPPTVVFPHFWSLLSYVSGDANVPFGFEQTLAIIALAVIIVVVIGTFLGFLIGSIRFVRNVMEEYIVAVYALPKITLIPFFWLLFGVSLNYRLGFGVLNGVFPLVIVTMYAAGGVDPALMKMAKSIGASRRERLFKVFLPSMVPSLMSGIRIGFVTTFSAVVTAEMFVGHTGIGFLARDFTNNFQTAELYGVVLATIIVAVTVNLMLLGIEKYLTRWKSLSLI